MNPLNSLANIGDAFDSFRSGVQSMSATIRRTGTQVRRAMMDEG